MKRLWVFGVLLFPGVVLADQVCFQRSTGTLLEYQSHARAGTCTANAVNGGLATSDVEEREVTRAEWQEIREAQIDAPARAQHQQREEVRQAKEQTLRQKLGLTQQEFDDLKDALR